MTASNVIKLDASASPEYRHLWGKKLDREKFFSLDKESVRSTNSQISLTVIQNDMTSWWVYQFRT